MTHEELEEARHNPISVALTVGKKVPTEWFEKAKGKKILGLACGGGQQGPVFAVKGYDVTIMDFSKNLMNKSLAKLFFKCGCFRECFFLATNNGLATRLATY